MSKQITHEQARQHLKDKIKDGNILTVLEYIKQQEKREKLGIKNMNNWKKIKDTNEYQEYELTKVLKTSFKVDKDDLEKDNTLLDFLKKKQEEEFKKTILDQLKEELENE